MTQNKTIHIGAHSAQFADLNVKGEQMKIDGERFYLSLIHISSPRDA